MKGAKKKWDSSRYDSKYEFVSRYGEELLALLNADQEDLILDLGCGTGDLTHLIDQDAGEVIGLDKSVDMIRTANEKYPKLKFVTGDAANFDFDRPFDAIFSNAALHWVLDYKGCIRSMYRNLRTGGRLVLEFGAKDNINTIVRALRSVLLQKGFTKQAGIELWYFPTVEKYSDELKAEGFDIVHASQFGRPTELNADIGDWLKMFAGPFFKDIPEPQIVKIVDEVIQLTRQNCYRKGKWYADYKRIRIVAMKGK